MSRPVAEAGAEHRKPGFFKHQTLFQVKAELFEDRGLVNRMNIADCEPIPGFNRQGRDYLSR